MKEAQRLVAITEEICPEMENAKVKDGNGIKRPSRIQRGSAMSEASRESMSLVFAVGEVLTKQSGQAVETRAWSYFGLSCCGLGPGGGSPHESDEGEVLATPKCTRCLSGICVWPV